jgi:hypothetical protein
MTQHKGIDMTLMKVDASRFGSQEIDGDLLPCHCGSVVEFSLAYGRTPYCFWCPNCGNNYHNTITNCSPEIAIKHFNFFIQKKDTHFEFRISNNRKADV